MATIICQKPSNALPGDSIVFYTRADGVAVNSVNCNGTGYTGYIVMQRETADSDLIEALNPQLAIDDSITFFGLAFLLLSTIWAGKRIYHLFTAE